MHDDKIMVAVGKRGDDEPLAQGHRWAQQSAGHLVVCHALSVPAIEILMQRADARTLAALEKERAAALAELRDHAHRVTGRSSDDLEVIVRSGTPHAVLLELADELQVSGIVIGDSRKSRLERVMLGTSAVQVVRHAHVPVLVARPSPDHGPVLVATDLSDLSLPAVAAAVAEAARRSAEIVMVHNLDLSHPVLGAFEPSAIVDEATANAVRDAAHDVMRSSLQRFGAEGRTLVSSGTPKSAIVKACRDENASLLVVGTHGRSGFARVALGSVAEALTRVAPCSVLVVRSRPRV